MRVIADHARATTFLVTDGVLPSNEGRGYVLRRILRRGLRHGRLLGLEEPFMATVTGRVVELMQAAYPELAEAPGARGTGDAVRGGAVRPHPAGGPEAGRVPAWRAEGQGRGGDPGRGDLPPLRYYGFPLDLLRDIAADQGLALDEVGFEREMAEQRARARESWVGSGEVGVPGEPEGSHGTAAPVEPLW